MSTNKNIIYITIFISLLLILCPTIYKVINNHKKDLYDVTNKKVIEAAITCKNRQLCLNEKITLKELYDNKLLDTISDPITKQIYKDTSYVIYENNKYVFIIED